MRIREENRNMVLLAAVGFLAGTVAVVASFVEPAPVPAERKMTYVADQTPVRVVGPLFVPNTRPNERR